MEPSSGLYTCLACQVAFDSAEEQRTHYRSDWHRYNLKRKVADLPPVTRDQFEQKVQAREALNAQDTQQQDGQFKGHCSVCRKTFGTKNTYDNHMRSKKHKEAAAKQASGPQKEQQSQQSGKQAIPKDNIDMTFTDDMTEEEIMAKIDEKIKHSKRLEETDCLFCTTKSSTFEENMTHMTTVHSFFIPDIEYLVDLKGLIRYLGEKISVGNVCLYCNGRGRGLRSLEAVRAHMISKGHCKIAYDDDEDALELADFYDFSSSYPQLKDGEEQDDDAEELAIRTQGIRLADDELSLVLPSGAVVGHRSLKRYYDQNLKPDETRESVLINKLIGQYTTMQGYESMRKRGGRLAITDGQKPANVRHTEAFKDVRIHQDYQTRVGLQSNKLQKYFRVQII